MNHESQAKGSAKAKTTSRFLQGILTRPAWFLGYRQETLKIRLKGKLKALDFTRGIHLKASK